MTPEELFALTGPPSLLGWAILILAPRRWPLLNLVPQVVIPLGFAVLYTGLILTNFAATGGGFGTLAAVRLLFNSDWMLVAGWVHYLAFDMAVGAWLALRMDRAGIGRLVQAPLLVLTFLFGPVGFLLSLLCEGTLRLVPSRQSQV